MSTEEELEAAWLALDEGRPEAALQHLSVVDPADSEHALIEAYACLDLIDWPRAHNALARAAQTLPQDEPLLLAAQGEWHLVHWEIDQARTLFEQAAAIEEAPRVLDRLALCADYLGEYDAADDCLRRLQAFDPELGVIPERLSPADFEREVARGAEDLPAEFRRSLDEIPVVIDPMPTLSLVEGGELEALPPDLLGLFMGASALDRSHEGVPEMPPRIYLFQRNLERACPDPSELREQIRITLYHELAHALGFDEDGVEEMGLE